MDFEDLFNFHSNLEKKKEEEHGVKCCDKRKLSE